jgi:hypothetical protein
MNIKQLFLDVRKAQCEIDALTLEQERIFTRLTSTTTRLKDVNVQSSSDGDALANGSADLSELSDEITAQLNRISSKQLKAARIIGMIHNSSYRDVLTWYYINAYTWERTAAVMNYSPVYIWELGNKALAEAQRIADTNNLNKP